MGTRRERFSKAPVGKLLTFSDDISLYDCENFILEGAINRYGFPHWLGHLAPLEVRIGDRAGDRFHIQGDDLLRLAEAIATGLEREQFDAQAAQVRKATTEARLNQILVRQYTDEVGLYPAANKLLRLGHSGGDVSDHGLAPWVCQLGAALRLFDEHLGTSYRGCTMTSEDIQQYLPGQIFVWAPFVSASRSAVDCLDGNVMFEIRPVSALSERDKRAARDISALSVHPEEQEVLLPMCCAFRVAEVAVYAGKHFIKLEILDHY